MLDLSKPVQVHTGELARVICIDAKGHHPIVALVASGFNRGEETVFRFRMDGSSNNQFRLVNRPPAFDPIWGHGHTTRGGQPARVICRDRKAIGSVHGDQPIVALVMDRDGHESVESFCPNGWWEPNRPGPGDLINKPAP